MFNRLDKRYGLADNQVFALEKMDQTIFIGTRQGVNTLDFITYDMNVIEPTRHLAVVFLFRHEDDLWIATTSKGLLIYNMNTQQLRAVNDSSMGRIVYMVKFDNAVWAATQYSGIHIYSLDGTLIEKNVHPGIKQIRKLAVCGQQLLIASLWGGIIKMDKNKTLLQLADNSSYHTFVCDKSEVVAANTSRVVHMDEKLIVKRSQSIQNKINSLFYYKGEAWQLHEDGLSRYGMNEMKYGRERLHYLYNNVQLEYEDYMLFGSTRGLVFVNMVNLQKRSWLTPELLAFVDAIDQKGQPFSVDVHFNNLIENRNYNLFYRFQHQKAYSLLKSGSLMVDQSPVSDTVYFKAVGKSGPVVPEVILDISPWLALSNEKNSGSEMGLNEKNNFYIFLSVFCLILMLVVFWLATRLRSVYSTHHKVDAMAQESDYEKFIRIHEDLHFYPEKYGEKGKDLIRCFHVLMEHRNIRYVKNLASVSGITGDAIRESVREIFDLKGTREFIAFSNQYISEARANVNDSKL